MDQDYQRILSQYAIVAGVDEAGRGPLAGPVVAAAVVLSSSCPIEGLRDSKKLSEKQRESLYDDIVNHAQAYAIAQASVEEIDQLNILQASLLAMQRAVEALSCPPEHVLIDGNRCPQLKVAATAVIKGDQKVMAISAASILAKVARDRQLIDLDRQYPGYGFAQHKGYGTKGHCEALQRLGPTPHHRRSFAPVRAALAMVK